MALPSSIWMTAPLGQMPSCYHGTPLEMVEQMANEVKPGLGVHDTIDLILRCMADERGIRVRLPKVASEELRAEAFVKGLLELGVALSTPSA
jgi:hypothetical protein